MRLIIYTSILLFVTIIISALSFDNTIKFTPVKYSGSLNLKEITTKSGENLIISNDISRPLFGNTYIGYLRNDTIVKYRKPLSTVGEIVYYFGYNNKDWREYANGKVKDKSVFDFVYWISVIVGLIIMSYRMWIFYDVTAWRNEFRNFNIITNNNFIKKYLNMFMIVFIIEFLFVIVTSWFLMNYNANIPCFLFGLVTYTILVLSYCAWVDKDFLNFFLKRIKRKVKVNNYKKNFNKLLQ